MRLLGRNPAHGSIRDDEIERLEREGKLAPLPPPPKQGAP
jgi:hypothetical protein